VGRREFVKLLGVATAVAAGGGLASTTFRNRYLTASQVAEAQEAAVDQIGKLPKRQLGTRMGNMQVTPIVLCQDWNHSLYAPGIAAGINYFHKAGYWKEMPDEIKNLPRESYYTDITVDSTPNNPDDEEGAYRQVT